MTIRDDLEEILESTGIRHLRRGTGPRPFAYTSFGGSALDEALIQAAWTVTFIADPEHDMQTLVAPFVRAVQQSTRYIYENFISDVQIPGTGADDVVTGIAYGSTAYDWVADTLAA